MGNVLFVRVKSNLARKELERRVLERRPRFMDVPGLLQKIYGRDDATGDVCGIYFFCKQRGTRGVYAIGAGQNHSDGVRGCGGAA